MKQIKKSQSGVFSCLNDKIRLSAQLIQSIVEESVDTAKSDWKENQWIQYSPVLFI